MLIFIGNTATTTGDSIYIDSTGSNEVNCFNDRVIGIESEAKHFIAAPPSKLELAKCIDKENKTVKCGTYYVSHVMLGEEVNIPSCVLDYCNQIADPTQFLMQRDNNHTCSINGPSQVLLSCGTHQGINITG